MFIKKNNHLLFFICIVLSIFFSLALAIELPIDGCDNISYATDTATWTWNIGGEKISSDTLPVGYLNRKYEVALTCEVEGQTIVNYSFPDVSMIDPSLKSALSIGQNTGVLSSTSLDSSLGAGTYAIEVFATDTASNEYHKTFSLEIKNTYSVVYNKNTTDTITDPLPLESGTFIPGDSLTISSSTFRRNGYELLGWNFDSSASIGLDSPHTILDEDFVLDSLTLYAIWKPEDYSITYNLDGGENDEDNPSTYTIETETITLQDPTKTGYTFKGWYSDDLYNNKITEITKGTTVNWTLYALWEINQYTITFDTLGGTEITAITQNYNTSVTPPSDPEKTGYTFDKWDKVIPATIPAEDITITAVWNAISYSITYNLDGGENDEDNPSTYTIETETISLQDPTKTGYTFKGWYLDNLFNSEVTEITIGSTGDKEFYAKWEIVTYTITYNLDSGTNNQSNPSTYTVLTETITLQDPTKDEYLFDGWYLEDTYQNKVLELTKGSTGDKNLFAKWSKIVSITETQQEKTYSGQKQSFDISGSSLSNFVIQYYYNSQWNEDAPINAGTYKVKVTREKDATYAAFDKTIDAGLVINKAATTIDVSSIEKVYKYTGVEYEVNSGATYSHSEDAKVTYEYNKFRDTGEYTITVKVEATNNYLAATTTFKVYVIPLPSFDESIQTYTYNAQKQDFIMKGIDKDLDYTITYYQNSQLVESPINAGIYDVNITRAQDDDYYELNKTIKNGLVITKYVVELSFVEDDYTYLYDYDNQMPTNQVSNLLGTYKNINGDATDLLRSNCALKGANITGQYFDIAGEYVATFIFVSTIENSNYCFDKSYNSLNKEWIYEMSYDKTFNIKKAKTTIDVSKISKVYKYTGSEIVINEGATYSHSEEIASVTYLDNKVINSGKYTIRVNVAETSNYLSKETSFDIYVKPIEKESDSKSGDKSSAIVEIDEGFPEDVSFEVEVVFANSVEDLSKNELTKSVTSINDKKLMINRTENLLVVYDVKLYKVVDGVKTSIQPSEIENVSSIVVKFLLPDGIDVSKITRLLHIHNDSSVEELAFDASKVDENGYYSIEISSLSSFAILYKKDCYFHYGLAGLGILYLLFVVIYFYAAKKKHKFDVLSIIATVLFAVGIATITCFGLCMYCYIVAGIDGLILILGILHFSIKINKKPKQKDDNEDAEYDEIKEPEIKEIAKDNEDTKVIREEKLLSDEEKDNEEDNMAKIYIDMRKDTPKVEPSREDPMFTLPKIDVLDTIIMKMNVADCLKEVETINNDFGSKTIINVFSNINDSSMFTYRISGPGYNGTVYKIKANKIAYVFVKNNDKNKLFIALKINSTIAMEIQEKHNLIAHFKHENLSSNEWYVLFIDDSFKNEEDIKNVIMKAYNFNKNK